MPSLYYTVVYFDKKGDSHSTVVIEDSPNAAADAVRPLGGYVVAVLAGINKNLFSDIIPAVKV